MEKAEFPKKHLAALTTQSGVWGLQAVEERWAPDRTTPVSWPCGSGAASGREQQTGFKSGKGMRQAVYCLFNTWGTSLWQDWAQSWNQIDGRNINNQITATLWQRKWENLMWRGSEAWLKTQHSGKSDRGNSGNVRLSKSQCDNYEKRLLAPWAPP